MRKILQVYIYNFIELRTEKIHLTISKINILAVRQAHMGRMGNNGQAQMCQIGQWQHATRL